MIGDDIEIVVVDIRGSKVRLGIQAPANVPVHRREVFDAITRGGHEIVSRATHQNTEAPTDSKEPRGQAGAQGGAQ